MISLSGLTPSWKFPIAAREVNFGRGRRSIGAGQIKVTVTGTKLSTGSATADGDPIRVFTEEEADAYFGAGSEIALQCYAALAIPGVVLWACPVAEAGGAVAGSLTITIAGTWTTTGTLTLRLGGKFYSVTVTPASTPTTVAADMVLKINGNSRGFCTAANVAGVITATTKSKGVRMNQWICAKDLTQAPAGLTATIAGGTALTGTKVPFASGAGADDVTNVLAKLTSDTYDYQAWAQNDATNAGLIRTQLNSEASALTMHQEHSIMTLTRGTSASMTFASATLNNQRMTLAHFTNSESHPSEISAQLAAVRSTTVGANPNARYNGVQLPTIAPQFDVVDRASIQVADALLNSGVLPLMTTFDGRVVIGRAIQSHCLNGSSPDFRTLDWGHADVPDRVSKELGADWEDFAEKNAYLSDEPANDAEAPPAGTAFPSLWNSVIIARLKICERNNWVQDVDANPPLTEFQTDRLMSAIPCIVRLQNHIVGIQVNQTAAAS
ncbi:MAG TPA: hypothetical protein VG734_25945 [Lacunisphaera sp.]|nr:hypothetical protein [Lacunisphaera sp.]